MKTTNIKKLLIFILYFLFNFINSNELRQNNTNFYRCGIDKFKPIPLSSKNIAPIDKNNPNYKRILDNTDEEGFKDFNIYLDLYNFEDEVERYGLSENRNLYVTGMTRAVDTLKTLLKVKQTKNYKFSDQDILDISINNWDKTKIGSNAGKGMVEICSFLEDLEITLKWEN